MERKYIVYKHITPSGKIYIGLTCQKSNSRWANGNGYKGSPHFYAAVKKYGWDNIEHSILVENLSKREATWLEKYLIRYYCSDNKMYGYNLTAGGEGSLGRKRTEETKAKWREKMAGHNTSEETRKKISNSLMGHYVSEESKAKMSASHMKPKKERVIKKNLVRSREGSNNSFYGKHHSENTKRQIALHNANRKSVLCIETGEVYESISTLAKALKRMRYYVSKCISLNKKINGLTYKII